MYTVHLTIRMPHWSGWNGGEVPQRDGHDCLDGRRLVRPAWRLAARLLSAVRLTECQHDSAAIIPVGDAPAPEGPGGGIDLFGKVGKTVLRVGHSVGYVAVLNQSVVGF
jgi:hypothetical protein